MDRLQVADVARIYELWNEYAGAFNDGDLDRWLALWKDDGIQMAPDGPRRRGKREIRAEMQPLFDLSNNRNMTVNTEEVRILGGWAYAHGAYDFEMTSLEGGDLTDCTGMFLSILEKQVDGSWKIAIDCRYCSASSRQVPCA